jgi:Flp pilus assembly protein CpaB
VPGAVSSSDQLNNLVVTQQIFSGEQVTTRAFGTPTELGIRAQIRGNERAFQLAGDENALLAGTLKEGDHVDVVGEWSLGGNNSLNVSKVILRNILVLQAPQTPTSSSHLGSSNDNFSVQLRVTDAQSQKLWWAEQEGKVSLEIRPPADSADSFVGPDNAFTLARSRG